MLIMNNAYLYFEPRAIKQKPIRFQKQNTQNNKQKMKLNMWPNKTSALWY